jgi:plasmid stabilization system protein ParE
MGQTRFVRLRYSLPALADLSAILDYIAAESPQGAGRVQSRIKTIIDLLLLHPHIGTRTDDPTIRRMTALPYPYLIFYEPTETEIIIHAVRHAARDPSGTPGVSR